MILIQNFKYNLLNSIIVFSTIKNSVKDRNRENDKILIFSDFKSVVKHTVKFQSFDKTCIDFGICSFFYVP